MATFKSPVFIRQPQVLGWDDKSLKRDVKLYLLGTDREGRTRDQGRSLVHSMEDQIGDGGITVALTLWSMEENSIIPLDMLFFGDAKTPASDVLLAQRWLVTGDGGDLDFPGGYVRKDT